MVAPVSGTEVKLRGFEAPAVSRIATDQVIALDGPVSGPGSATLSVLARDGLGSLPPPTGEIPGLIDPLVPVIYRDTNGAVQVANYSLAEVAAGGGSMFLGPKDEPPLTDNFGNALKPGHSYYNLNDETIYAWSSGGRWVISAASLPAAMKVFYYSYPVAGSTIPPNGPNTPDAMGQVLAFDISSGQASISGINVFQNGVLLVNGTDYIVHEGGAGGDYITTATPICANSVVVVQLYTTGQTTFQPNAVKLDTALWLFDGVTSTFTMVDFNAQPVFPGNAVNCLVAKDNSILQPNVDFIINGDQITFVPAPFFGDMIWAVVGVPTSGTPGEKGTRVTPWSFGGAGNRVTDDSDAVESAINQANATGATLDLAGGAWRITRQMPPLLYPRVDGGGSGEIYVDYDMAGEPVLDCRPNLGDEYDVTAIAVVQYDFEGAFSADSTVTRLTVTLTTEQAMPTVGSVGKVTSEDQLVGVETGDNAGQHITVVAVDAVNRYVYTTTPLVDTYVTNRKLSMLGAEQVLLRSFGVRANWDALVAGDWNGSFIQIIGAYCPKVSDVWVRDGAQGITCVGCFQNSTRGVRVGRMRNATASETPAVPGYGVVDGGCYQPTHHDLGGFDARHIYTTISPDAATWPRIAWGRTFKPLLVGGQAGNCSAAAYDTHSDAYEPTFIGLVVFGGYYGQNSAGSGIQFRGVRGRASSCRVFNTAVGYELYKQFTGEANNHTIENCEYYGDGTPIRSERDPGLSAGNARQTVIVGNFLSVSTSQIGLDLMDTDLLLHGICRMFNRGSTTDARAIYHRAAAKVYGRGGKLIYDISGMSSPTTPRLLTVVDNSCAAIDLEAKVIAGSNTWQAVVSENEAAAISLPASAFVIDCDCDKAPVAASGGYSQNGGSNLLTAGALVLRLTVNGARVPASRGSAFTLNASMLRQTILCTAAFTVTVPAVGILGPEFTCTLAAMGGTVTVDGPGTTNPTIPSGSIGTIRVINGKSWIAVAALTDLT